MTPRIRFVVVLVGVVFFVAHAAALPRSLEDIDSINFALGVESFDVASHRPHPPGSPVFVALAKGSTAAIGVVAPGMSRDQRAAIGLAIWGVMAGTVAVLALTEFWVAVGLTPPVLALLAAIVGVAAPLFWFTAARPLSDTPGLVAAVFVQAALVRGLRQLPLDRGTRLPWFWIGAACGAGLAVGLRSQTMWLTGPLLAWGAIALAVRGRTLDSLRLVGAAAAGCLIWAVPLVWLSGGVARYLASIGSQGAQDFSGVEMLFTRPSWSLLGPALRHTFAGPWPARALANAVLGLALIGAVWMAARRRRGLAFVLAGFLPYLLFHLAFQETATLRYALPVVVPVAGLAVAGLSLLGLRGAAIGTLVVAAAEIVVVQPRLMAYGADAAPVFRALQDMRSAFPEASEPPVLLMHHQVWWGVRRAIDWYRPVWDVGPQPFPGDREWLRAVRHWTAGGTAPVWLLADITRTDMALFDPRARVERGRYVQDERIRELIGGTRLDSLAWWAIRPPGWMLGSGWSLTPEIAGVTSLDRARPDLKPAEAFLRREGHPLRVLVGGRHVGPADAADAAVDVELDGRPIARWTVGSGDLSQGGTWFTDWIDLPDGTGAGAGPYARLTVRVTSPDPGRPAPHIVLEQFDAAPAEAVMSALADGWNEQEANPRSGQLWRWTTSRSAIEVRGARRDVHVLLRGASPLEDFERPPDVVLRAGERGIGRFRPAAAFHHEFVVPLAALEAAGGRLTLETSETFVPGDRNGGPDRRMLGLKLYDLEIR